MSSVSRVRAWIGLRPMAADAALAAALLGAGLLSYDVTIGVFADEPSIQPRPTVVVAAVLTVMVGPLAVRRRAPLTVLLVSTAAYIALVLLTGPELESSITPIALSLAIYSAAAHGRAPWRNWVCGTCVVAVTALIVARVSAIAPDLPVLYHVFAAVTNLALFCALWALGAALGVGAPAQPRAAGAHPGAGA